MNCSTSSFFVSNFLLRSKTLYSKARCRNTIVLFAYCINILLKAYSLSRFIDCQTLTPALFFLHFLPERHYAMHAQKLMLESLVTDHKIFCVHQRSILFMHNLRSEILCSKMLALKIKLIERRKQFLFSCEDCRPVASHDCFVHMVSGLARRLFTRSHVNQYCTVLFDCLLSIRSFAVPPGHHPQDKILYAHALPL